jgi:hypothetical protein
MNIGLKRALFLRCWILVRRLLEARDLPQRHSRTDVYLPNEGPNFVFLDFIRRHKSDGGGGGVNSKTKHSYQSESIARFMY